MFCGIYSPSILGPRRIKRDNKTGFNVYGEPAQDLQDKYNPLAFYWYDQHGFDMYGYSAFMKTGTCVGDGKGIDRFGYTEYHYYKNGIPKKLQELTHFPREAEITEYKRACLAD